MRFSTLAATAAVGAGVVNAQNTTSICDKYTIALLTNNTAANQYTLLTLLVNTAGLGNFTGPGSANPTLPGSLVSFGGLLSPGTYNGEAVNLLPYFDGTLASTNSNGTASSVNWLDGGGSAPIIADPLSSGTVGSNQYTLFTHLYQYFGALLGCSGLGTTDFPAYMGVQSQATVHQFMDLDTAQVSYFIENVGLAAESFGVSAADVATVATTLNNTFGYRCAPAVTVIASAGPVYDSICQNVTCPLAANASCGTAAPASYPAVVSTAASSATSTSGSSATTTGSSTSSATGVASYTGAAVALAPGVLAGLAGLAAFAL